jgi:hypothetical protein
MSAIFTVPIYVEIVRGDDAAPGTAVYRDSMRWHAQRADLSIQRDRVRLQRHR